MRSVPMPMVMFFIAPCLCLTSVASSALTVEELLDAMPADNADAATQRFEQAFDAGEPLVMALCARVTTSEAGVDPRVHYALNGLANHAARPGNDAVRTQLARWCEAALQQADAPETQQFFMGLLRVCGDARSVDALLPFACDNAACHDAIMTIEAIGGEAAVSALISLACDDNAAAIEAAQTALYHLRQRPAPHVETSLLDMEVRAAAVTPPSADTRARIAATCRETLAGNALSRPERMVALRALALSDGVNALPELLAAINDPDPHYWGAALDMARELAGPDVSRAFAQKGDQFPAIVRPQVVFMLGLRDDRPARKAVREAIDHEDIEVRLAAYTVITRQGLREALAPLARALGRAEDSNEINAIKEAMLRLPDPEVSDSAAKRLRRASAAQKAACLDIIAVRQAERHLDTVRACLEEEESQARRAAFNAIAAIGAPDDIEGLYGLLLAAPGNVDVAALRAAIIAIAKRNDAVDAVVVKAASLLETADATQARRVLGTLEALGGDAALAAAQQFTETALFGEQTDAEAAGVALEVFGLWQDPKATDILFALFTRIEDSETRLAALRQFTISVQRAISGAARQQALLEKAGELCLTDEEQALIAETIERIQPKDKTG